ncbi:MAG: FecR domain-containing protein [Rhodanobacteraceae bacterium]|nr:FecR domain-containing protein [Rhodanobacteraceae bacterium]MBP9154421.1 FecR domain-containing protein [Xanthomonadales bacterium]HQW81534.1 FecR domain-containing protein [Pseudomonadota bacterium]
MNDGVRQQAVQWLMQVRDQPEDVGVQQAFDLWLAADDRHRLGYLDALIAFNAAADAHAPMHAPMRPGVARRHRLWLGAAFGVLLAVVGLYGPRWFEQVRADETSAPGVARELVLADGSQLRLAPDSAIAIDFSASERDIELLRGAVTIDVAADSRPLILRHHQTTVRDIGTRFAVQAAPDVLRVGVVSGVVEVTRADRAAVRIPAGAQIEWHGAAVEQRPWQEHRDVADMLLLDHAPAALALAQWAAFEGSRVQWIGAPPSDISLDAALPMRSAEERHAALATLAREFGLDVLLDGAGLVVLRAAR